MRAGVSAFFNLPLILSPVVPSLSRYLIVNFPVHPHLGSLFHPHRRGNQRCTSFLSSCPFYWVHSQSLRPGRLQCPAQHTLHTTRCDKSRVLRLPRARRTPNCSGNATMEAPATWPRSLFATSCCHLEREKWWSKFLLRVRWPRS